VACGCPSEQCTCFLNGDAFTGGNGSAGTPYTVENLPFAPTSPTNSVTITPGGVKNHTPAIDVALSSDPNNAIQYDTDGLLVDPCDMVDAVTAENALTCGPDGLLVDRCDILTPTTQALGDLLIAGPDCTAQVMADPSDVDQVIAALGGQWGQRPLLSADIGNASSIGTDGGIFSPSFGASAPVFGVQFFNTSGNILDTGGPYVVYEGSGLPITGPFDTLTMPPAIIGAEFYVWDRDTVRLNLAADTGDAFKDPTFPFGQASFQISRGQVFKFTCLESGYWDYDQLLDGDVLNSVNDLSNDPIYGHRSVIGWSTGPSATGVFEYVKIGSAWTYVGGPEAHIRYEPTISTVSAAYVSLAGPSSIGLNFKGDYRARMGALMQHDSVNGIAWMSMREDANNITPAMPNDARSCKFQAYAGGANGQGFTEFDFTTTAVAGVVRPMFRQNAGTGFWANMSLTVTPIRIRL
jgi:hypothetical protein